MKDYKDFDALKPELMEDLKKVSLVPVQYDVAYDVEIKRSETPELYKELCRRYEDSGHEWDSITIPIPESVYEVYDTKIGQSIGVPETGIIGGVITNVDVLPDLIVIHYTAVMIPPLKWIRMSGTEGAIE